MRGQNIGNKKEVDNSQLQTDLLSYTGAEDLDNKKPSNSPPVYNRSGNEVLTFAIEEAEKEGANTLTSSHFLKGIIRHLEPFRQKQTDLK